MSKVEEVARAMFEASPLFKNRWEDQGPVEKAVFRNIARAAIAAMREPSEAMVKQLGLGVEDLMETGPYLGCGEVLVQAYRNCIDTALE